jgi:ubiquinone/menaquinone biosynthesis C-methylase UbiE
VFHPEGPTFAELMQQALASTKDGYDMIAPKFDKTPFRTPDPLVEVCAREIGAVATGIDFCCGTGAGLAMLKRTCTERVVGIDMSAGMLAQAEKNLAELSGAKAEFINDDVLTHAFAPEFDAATCFGAFGHIDEPDQPRFLAQIHAALKPEGRFVFLTAGPAGWTSRTWWLYRGFNAVMRVRNALIQPPFIMYYLNFLLPRATKLCEEAGFTVTVKDVEMAPPFNRFKLVIATKT